MAIQLATKEGFTSKLADVAEKCFKRLEEKETKHNQEESKEELVRWVAKLLRQRTNGTHRCTNAASQRDADIYFEGVTLPDEIAKEVRQVWANEWEAENEGRKGRLRKP